MKDALQEIKSKRFLEIALVINNVDIHNGLLKGYHQECANKGCVIDDKQAIGGYLRSLCYDKRIDIAPIAYLLDDTTNEQQWLNHLETQVVPYLVQMNVITKNI